MFYVSKIAGDRKTDRQTDGDRSIGGQIKDRSQTWKDTGWSNPSFKPHID